MDANPALLRWYRPRGRAYPWRVRPTPYRTLVSEVMLQQTQAARVAPAFGRFVARFPTVRSLAAAAPGEPLREWSGLGHNRRAVLLWRAAGEIVARHGGRVPRGVEELRRLPGVGPYTAAAVASIAYGAAVPAIDRNVARVVARAVLGVDPGSASPGVLRAAAEAAIDRSAPGAWNQAVMDLGRAVCRPVPRCSECPIEPSCRRRAAGIPLPEPRAPRARPEPFPGSNRQLRGRILALLHDRSPLSQAEIARETGRPRRDVSVAVGSLVRDGLLLAPDASGERGGRGPVRPLPSGARGTAAR